METIFKYKIFLPYSELTAFLFKKSSILITRKLVLAFETIF